MIILEAATNSMNSERFAPTFGHLVFQQMYTTQQFQAYPLIPSSPHLASWSSGFISRQTTWSSSPNSSLCHSHVILQSNSTKLHFCASHIVLRSHLTTSLILLVSRMEETAQSPPSLALSDLLSRDGKSNKNSRVTFLAKQN